MFILCLFEWSACVREKRLLVDLQCWIGTTELGLCLVLVELGACIVKISIQASWLVNWHQAFGVLVMPVLDVLVVIVVVVVIAAVVAVVVVWNVVVIRVRPNALKGLRISSESLTAV